MTILIAVAVATATVMAVAIVRGRGHEETAVATPQTVATATDDRAARMAVTVAVLAGMATVLLTVAAFVLSYAHLEGVAVRNGVPAGFHAWVWPGTIDTFIIIGELLIFLAAIAHLGFSWWGWGLTIGGSAGSIAFNVLGVGADAPPMQYAVAAAPPVAALFAFGALMHQVRRYVAVAMTTPAVATATDTVMATNDDVATDMATAIAALMATPAATPVMVPVATVTDMATVTPPRPTVAPVAMATDDDVATVMATPRASLVKRVAGVATDTATAIDRALVATDTAMMTALTGRPYTPTVATRAATVKPRKRVTTATPATPEVMAARVATVTAMLSEDPHIDGEAVATAIPGISLRTARRVLATAKAGA